MKQKKEISAILDKDLRKILDKYDLSSKIDKGEINCFCCQEIITWDNIAAIKVIENNIVLICDNLDCIDKIEKN